MKNILLIEDDLTYSKIIRGFLEKNGYAVAAVPNLREAFAEIKKTVYALVVTDYRLPDGTGMEFLEYCNREYPDLPVILITSYSDIRTAVKSMKLGAVEYITKPVNPDELLLTVQETLAQPVEATKSTQPSPNLDTYFVGETDQAINLEKQINLVAPTDMSVLVLGESGTGKEFISKRIHEKSLRKDGPFVAVDCGALSPELSGSELFGHVKGAFTGAVENKTGHFEAANGGTIFLDEIGNLSYDIQIKLLRAIQERKIRKIGGNKDIAVDVRIIAATNDNLRDNASNGTFREDLYYRINEFSIQATPLRERGSDFDGILSLFLKQSNANLNKRVTGLSDEVRDCFARYSWPGNLRELKNVVRRAVLLTGEGEVQLEAIPEEITSPSPTPLHTAADLHPVTSTDELKGSFEDQEKNLITQILESVRHNKSKAAKILKMDRKTLYAKIEKYGIYD